MNSEIVNDECSVKECCTCEFSLSNEIESCHSTSPLEGEVDMLSELCELSRSGEGSCQKAGRPEGKRTGVLEVLRLCHRGLENRRVSIYKKSAPTLAEFLSLLFAGQPKTAFTLAEVLITLGIIGVVAAMTLPGLISNFEKKKNIAVLQRAYSDLGKFVQDFEIEYDCAGKLTNCCPNNGEFATKFALFLIDKHKFKQLKGVEIFHFYSFNGNVVDFRITQSSSLDASKGTALIAPGGAYMYIVRLNQSDLYYNVNGNLFRAQVEIFTDNNKFYKYDRRLYAQSQAKATMGKNIFEAFVMDDERIVPNGSSYCNVGNSWAYNCVALQEEWNLCDSSTASDNRAYRACLSRIIEDGWQIKYY